MVTGVGMVKMGRQEKRRKKSEKNRKNKADNYPTKIVRLVHAHALRRGVGGVRLVALAAGGNIRAKVQHQVVCP